MNEHEVTAAVYRMNPATDRIVFGDELEEGMWVLAEDPDHRQPFGGSEDEKIRRQRFRRVTRLTTTPLYGGTQTRFIGEWVDGYAEIHSWFIEMGWLVKKNPPGQETS